MPRHGTYWAPCCLPKAKNWLHCVRRVRPNWCAWTCKALKTAFAAGGIHLAKPSQGEFESLIGRKLPGHAEVAEAAAALVKAGKARMIAVTMGEDGGVLAWEGGVVTHPGVQAVARSTTGAGDSFLAAMVFGLLSGEDPPHAFRRGIAAGTAAVLTPGTDLCQPAEIERVLASLP